MEIFGSISKGFNVAIKSIGLVIALFVFNLLGSIASLPFATIAPGATASRSLPRALWSSVSYSSSSASLFRVERLALSGTSSRKAS